MNTSYIQKECQKRNIEIRFRMSQAGIVAGFLIGFKNGVPQWWNSLVPIDDESDTRFVDFVESEYKRLLTNESSGQGIAVPGKALENA